MAGREFSSLLILMLGEDKGRLLLTGAFTDLRGAISIM
jgi:hypothetical protein